MSWGCVVWCGRALSDLVREVWRAVAEARDAAVHGYPLIMSKHGDLQYACACLPACVPGCPIFHPRHCRLPLLPAPGAALSGYLTDCVCLTGLQIRQPLLDRERCWGRDCRAERGDHRRRRRRQSRPDNFLLLGGSWRRRRGSCSAAREVNELLGCGGDGSGWWCGVDAILLADRRAEWRERGAELSALLDPSGVATSCCDRGYDEPVGGGVPRSRPVYAQATHHT